MNSISVNGVESASNVGLPPTSPDARPEFNADKKRSLSVAGGQIVCQRLIWSAHAYKQEDRFRFGFSF